MISGIMEIAPDFVASCFDAPGPNFRHKKFIAYQANRPKTEQELKEQIDIVRKSVGQIGLPLLMKKGFEADDLLGTISRKVKSKTLKVIIITGDKDLMQLVDKDVELFLMKRGVSGAKLIDKKEVENFLGIKPSQVVDFKALVGDPSDNYSGVYGIGPKTAANLLKNFGSLDNIYKNLDKITPAVAQKLKKDKESAYLSYDLAKIDRQVKIKFKLKDAKWADDKISGLRKTMVDLGFRSLVKRVDEKFSKANLEKQMSLI